MTVELIIFDVYIAIVCMTFHLNILVIQFSFGNLDCCPILKIE